MTPSVASHQPTMLRPQPAPQPSYVYTINGKKRTLGWRSLAFALRVAARGWIGQYRHGAQEVVFFEVPCSSEEQHGRRHRLEESEGILRVTMIVGYVARVQRHTALVNDKKEAIPTRRKDIVLQRSWPVLSVHDVARLHQGKPTSIRITGWATSWMKTGLNRLACQWEDPRRCKVTSDNVMTKLLSLPHDTKGRPSTSNIYGANLLVNLADPLGKA